MSLLLVTWLSQNAWLYLDVWHNGRFSEFSLTRILALILVLAKKLENVRLFLRQVSTVIDFFLLVPLLIWLIVWFDVWLKKSKNFWTSCTVETCLSSIFFGWLWVILMKNRRFESFNILKNFFHVTRIEACVQSLVTRCIRGFKLVRSSRLESVGGRQLLKKFCSFNLHTCWSFEFKSKQKF